MSRDTPTGLTPHEYGLIGALRRWGPPRIVRIDDLSADQRARVHRYIETVRRQSSAAGAER